MIDAICAHKMQDRVFVSSFNHISMQHFKELCPDIETGLLYDKPFLDIDKYIERSNADNMHPRYMLLQYQPELVGPVSWPWHEGQHLDSQRRRKHARHAEPWCGLYYLQLP